MSLAKTVKLQQRPRLDADSSQAERYDPAHEKEAQGRRFTLSAWLVPRLLSSLPEVSKALLPSSASTCSQPSHFPPRCSLNLVTHYHHSGIPAIHRQPSDLPTQSSQQ